VLPGRGDLVCPGGVRPAGLAGVGDVAEPLADGVTEAVAVARGVARPDAAGAEPADGEGAAVRPGLDGDGLAVLRAGAPALPSLDATAAGARGAAHSANGAAGPPAIATTTAPRQSASAAPDMAPIRRMLRRRLPDGSAKTGLECTAGV
jgi:hypothetical protein